jgi:hypothetical protein
VITSRVRQGIETKSRQRVRREVAEWIQMFQDDIGHVFVK